MDDVNIRFIISLLCRTIAGLGSLVISAYGVYAASWTNFYQDTVLVSLFCMLPILSFPVFLLSFRTARWSVALHWISAIGFLAVFSMVEWRTCAELGYCEGLLRTVLVTLSAHPVEAAFGVAVINLAGLLLGAKRRHNPRAMLTPL